MFGIVPKGFIPDQDNDSLNVNLQAAQGTSFYDMVEVRAAGRRRSSAQNPNVDTFIVEHRRRRRRRRPNNGRLQRPADAARAARRSRAAADRAAAPAAALRFPGFRAFVSVPPALQIGGAHGQQHLQR